MSDTTTRPSKDKALLLMSSSMPPFEKFLEHCSALQEECEKAGALTPERTDLFAQYREALIAARAEYEDLIANFVCDNFSDDEIALLVAFYDSPTHKVVEKALGLSADINNIGTAWQTKVLERCPEVWKMLMDNVGEWQEKNMPKDTEISIPDAPPARDGWKRVEPAPMAAEEFVPSAAVEEAELERLRSS